MSGARREAGAAVPLGLVVTLGILSAVGPVATDLYLPGFPDIAADLGVDERAVQQTLTTYMIGMALGQLCLGPLSDRWGRMRPLVVSTAVAIVASTVAVLTADLTVLVLMRFVQGFAAAGGIVISRAIIRDLATGVQAARLFSVIMVVIGITPVLAPLVGGLLVGVTGWRGLMAIVSACFAVALVLALLLVRETLPRGLRERSVVAALANTGHLVRNRAYVCFTLIAVFGFVVVFCFISASSFVMQNEYGLDPVGYALFFAVNGVGMLAATLTNRWLVGVIRPELIIGFCLALQLLATALMTVLALVGGLTGPALLVLLVLTTLTVPPLISNATALGLSAVREGVGMASSLIGTLQFGLGAVVTGVAAGVAAGSPLGMVLPMLVCAVAGAISFAALRRARRC